MAGDDFIPAPQASQSDFIPYSANSAPNPPSQPNNYSPQDQSGPVMRFLKAAGSRLYAGTAGAGPTQSSTISSPTDIAQWQKENAGKGFFSNIPAPFEGNDKSPLQMVGSVASELNPVDVQKFQSGDVAGGIGSTAANLLMLRQAFKSRGLPNAGEFSIGKTSAMPEAAAPAPEFQNRASGTLGFRGNENAPIIEAGVPQGEDAMEYARRGSAGEPPPSTMPQWSRQSAKGMQTGTAEGPVPAEANPNNQYVTSAPPRSNLNKNQAQMAKFQGTASGPVESPAEQGAIEQHSSLNSPTEAQAYLEQASQKLFNKPYNQLSVTERLKTLREGGKMQQEARTAAAPRVPTSDADMNDLLRQTLIKRGLTPPPQ